MGLTESQQREKDLEILTTSDPVLAFKNAKTFFKSKAHRYAQYAVGAFALVAGSATAAEMLVKGNDIVTSTKGFIGGALAGGVAAETLLLTSVLMGSLVATSWQKLGAENRRSSLKPS